VAIWRVGTCAKGMAGDVPSVAAHSPCFECCIVVEMLGVIQYGERVSAWYTCTDSVCIYTTFRQAPQYKDNYDTKSNLV